MYVLGLSETQSIWINSFEDYVDDFVYFVTNISKISSQSSSSSSTQHHNHNQHHQLPVYLLAHSMGGLIASIAMSRYPSLINRAILCAPMLRNKCGMKMFDFKYPLPQPVAYFFTYLSCYFGLG
jgi:lysophospholipase